MPQKARVGKTGRGKPPAPGPGWPPFLAAHAALLHAIEARLRAAELPELAWYDVLWALERAPKERLRMHELADALVVPRSSLTRLIDRLEAAGLVVRERGGDDRRGAHAVLAPAGRALRRRMWPVYAQAIMELFDAQLTAAENAAMAEMCRRLAKAAREAP
ncbi:MAG TPA: MarR family transcriptional regulator [Xanthobacteraceae bacterium]|nr:MarR family transcriptional regulator [Xanthobacteraceae bacterium]